MVVLFIYDLLHKREKNQKIGPTKRKDRSNIHRHTIICMRHILKREKDRSMIHQHMIIYMRHVSNIEKIGPRYIDIQ